MIAQALLWLLLKFTKGGEETMLIMMLAGRVARGAMPFSEVPGVLQSKVYDELKANGIEFLAGDYTPAE